MDISQEELRRFLSYDPLTGVFTRIEAMSARQARRVGQPCGSTNKANGYVEIHVGGRKHLAHRLAWIYMRGVIPDGARVDHKNLNRSDNRIDNLRIATHAQNLQNCKVRADNTSGIKGVSWDRFRGQWVASVGKRRLGRFDTLLDAASARKSAALRAFGEFSRE